MIQKLFAMGLLVLGIYYCGRALALAHWNDPPEPSPTIEHEGDDWSSQPYPSCLPYGNSKVSDPTLPHSLCFDGSNSYARGPASRFL